MYDVKALKNPVSFVRNALSMIWDGNCRGMPGREGAALDEYANDGIRELTNRLTHIGTS